MNFVIFKGGNDLATVAVQPQMVSAIVPAKWRGEDTCKLYMVTMNDPVAEVFGTVDEVVKKLERRDG